MSPSKASSEPWPVSSLVIRDSHMTERHLSSQCLPPGCVTGSPNLAQSLPGAQLSGLLFGSVLPVANSLKEQLILTGAFSQFTHTCCDPNHSLVVELTVQLRRIIEKSGLSSMG